MGFSGVFFNMELEIPRAFFSVRTLTGDPEVVVTYFAALVMRMSSREGVLPQYGVERPNNFFTTHKFSSFIYRLQRFVPIYDV